MLKKKKTFKYSMKPTHQISVSAGALAHLRSICRDQVGEDKRRGWGDLHGGFKLSSVVVIKYEAASVNPLWAAPSGRLALHQSK